MTREQAEKIIKKAKGDFEVFLEWMNGQTMGMYPNGEVDFYDCDVERFVKYKCNPKNESLSEWD